MEECIITPIFKKNGDAQDCNSYRDLKLMNHSMKIWGRFGKARVRQEVAIFEEKYGFMPGNSTTYALGISL